MTEEYFQEDAQEKWLKKNDIEPESNVPESVIFEYNRFISIFSQIFGENNLRKIQTDEKGSNKRAIRRAIDNNTYIELLLNKSLSFERLQEIFTSLDINIPNNILKMKVKVEQGYDSQKRDLLALRHQAFIDQVKEKMLPLLQDIKESEKIFVESTIKKFLTTTPLQSIHEFTRKIQNNSEYFESILRTFIQVKTDKYGKTLAVNKIPNYNEKLEHYLNDYAEKFVEDFAQRLNRKLGEINTTFNYPTLDILDSDFHQGRYQGQVRVTYENGFTFTLNVQIILAGGMIQRLHYRYLIDIYYEGKNISNTELEQKMKAFISKT
jgi:hypothetical protein